MDERHREVATGHGRWMKGMMRWQQAMEGGCLPWRGGIDQGSRCSACMVRYTYPDNWHTRASYIKFETKFTRHERLFVSYFYCPGSFALPLDTWACFFHHVTQVSTEEWSAWIAAISLAESNSRDWASHTFPLIKLVRLLLISHGDDKLGAVVHATAIFRLSSLEIMVPTKDFCYL